jgi:hypothetical protein
MIEQKTDAPTPARVRGLAGRLAGVEGVRAIKRLQHAWGQYAEAGDYAAMADLFAPDGRLVLPPREARGREEILALLVETMGGGDASPAPDRLDVRLQLSPVVTIADDGRSGRGRWHELTLSGRHGERAEWSGGIHENEYVLVDGVWRISVLRHHPQFAGAHEDGWRNVSDAVPLVPFHFTPDQAGTPVPPRLEADADPAALPGLAARARRLIDESEVQNLLSAYGFYVDRKLWDDVGDLFADDGVLRWGDDEWEGRAGIRLGLESRSTAGLADGEFFDHLQLMPIVEVSADRSAARVRALELQMVGTHGGRGWWGVRVCDGEFMRTDAGWRIAALRYSPRLLADHARGWADGLPPRPEIGTAYPESRGPAIAFAHPVRDQRDAPDAASDADASLDDLEKMISVAEAFDGAENVACAYGYFLDESHWDESADLFARDGWKELSFVGTYIGRERIRDSLVARYGRRPRRPTFLPIHQKTQPFVTVEPDGRARIRLKMLQVNSGWDTEASFVSGVYEEQIVREDGVWRIHGMDLEYIVVAEWSGGLPGVTRDLGRIFAPTPEAIEAFDPAPDAPLRGLAFAPFPDIGPLGFHFANPVSGREPAIRWEWSDGRFDSSTFFEPGPAPASDMTGKAST